MRHILEKHINSSVGHIDMKKHINSPQGYPGGFNGPAEVLRYTREPRPRGDTRPCPGPARRPAVSNSPDRVKPTTYLKKCPPKKAGRWVGLGFSKCTGGAGPSISFGAPSTNTQNKTQTALFCNCNVTYIYRICDIG
jgi:hypothetical protein